MKLREIDKAVLAAHEAGRIDCRALLQLREGRRDSPELHSGASSG